MAASVSAYLTEFACQMTYHGETRLVLTLQLELSPQLRQDIGFQLLHPLLPRDYTVAQLKQGFVANYYLLNHPNADASTKLWRSLGLFAGLGQLDMVQLLLRQTARPADFQFQILKSALKGDQQQVAQFGLSLGPIELPASLAANLKM